MAIAVNTVILGQQADVNLSYCYLYEPLKIRVIESDPVSQKMYVDVERFDSITGGLVDTFIKYADFDIVPAVPITFDLMELTQQLHKADLYKYSSIYEFNIPSKQSIVSKYVYSFRVYTEITTDYPKILKLPIVGGRDFQQFNPIVTHETPLDEFSYYELDKVELQRRWGIKDFYLMNLPNLIYGNPYNPIVTDSPGGPGKFIPSDGGILYWKSRFGGWMFWGFDIQRKTFNQSYEGDLTVSMFESTNDAGGNIFVPVNYTGISTDYNIELKSLSLSRDELKAVSGIASSPAIYFSDTIGGRLELMRMSSFSAPFSNLANGGDFTVGLTNISRTSFKTK